MNEQSLDIVSFQLIHCYNEPLVLPCVNARPITNIITEYESTHCIVGKGERAWVRRSHGAPLSGHWVLNSQESDRTVADLPLRDAKMAAVLICGCGYHGCVDEAVELQITPDRVIWSNLRPSPRSEPYRLGSWTFDRTQYDSARHTLHEQLRAMDPKALQDTLLPLEHAHLTPGVRSARAALESLLHESFTEIGASGRLYTRDDIIPHLLAEQSHPPRTISDFRARRLADTVALTTYTLTRTDEDGSQHHSRRSSLWIHEHTTWRLTFHQGTNLPSPPPSRALRDLRVETSSIPPAPSAPSA